MANKRIKISELPKITWNKIDASSSLSEKDYLPIAVTDATNATVKTTQTITTRELQRFLLLHDNGTSDDEWDKNKLVIGGVSTVVELTGTARINHLEVEGTFTAASPNFTNLNVAALTASGNIQAQTLTLLGASGNTTPLIVGSTAYPSILAGKYSLLGTTDSVNSPLQEVTFSDMVSNATVTSNTNRPVVVNSQGQISFNTTYEQFFSRSGLFDVTGAGSKAGKIVFIDPVQGGFDFSIQKDTLEDAVDVVTNTFLNSTGDGSVLKTTNSSLTLAEEIESTDGGTTHHKRVIVRAPLVLGTKHINDIDLTERVNSINIPAAIGEIRWNIFNEIPTIYLAVYDDPNAGEFNTDIGTGSLVNVDENAKIWFGVPLFGTIVNTENPSVTANKYTNDD